MIKKKKLTGNFSQVGNEIWTAKVSPIAKVLFGYLNSKPKEWKISWRVIAEQINCHIDTIYKARDELIKAQFIRIERLENEICVEILNGEEQINLQDSAGTDEPSKHKQNANKKEKETQKLATACFESLDLTAFSDDERAGILEFFEFRARNTRKSPFSEHTAKKLFKQFSQSKTQGTDICAVFDRCIANGWVGYEWGEREILKSNKYMQWYGKNVSNFNGVANASANALPPLPNFWGDGNKESIFIKERLKRQGVEYSQFYGEDGKERLKNSGIRVLGRRLGVAGFSLYFLDEEA